MDGGVKMEKNYMTSGVWMRDLHAKKPYILHFFLDGDDIKGGFPSLCGAIKTGTITRCGVSGKSPKCKKCKKLAKTWKSTIIQFE